MSQCFDLWPWVYPPIGQGSRITEVSSPTRGYWSWPLRTRKTEPTVHEGRNFCHESRLAQAVAERIRSVLWKPIHWMMWPSVWWSMWNNSRMEIWWKLPLPVQLDNPHPIILLLFFPWMLRTLISFQSHYFCLVLFPPKKELSHHSNLSKFAQSQILFPSLI